MEGASWGRAQLRARGGAAAPQHPRPDFLTPPPRAPVPWPRNPRLRSVSGPRGSPSARRSTIILETGVPQPPSPAALGPCWPRGLRPLHVSTSGLTLMPKTAQGRAPPWEAGRVPGRVSHVTGCVCVCSRVRVGDWRACALRAAQPGVSRAGFYSGDLARSNRSGAPAGRGAGPGAGPPEPLQVQGWGPPPCLRGHHPVPPPPGPGHALLLGALGAAQRPSVSPAGGGAVPWPPGPWAEPWGSPQNSGRRGLVGTPAPSASRIFCNR